MEVERPGRKDRLYGALCALLVIASVLGSVPILAMGINDDWSYAWTAREFARTGHLAYDGWVGAMVAVQAVWGGLLIRLFGFSFTLLRLSTLPFAVGCALFLYALGRRAGLQPAFALFGTLAVALSPVFIPMAASFMTDVPGFFFWLAALYCAVRAWDSGSATGACAWLAAMALLGAAGGTERQVVWAVPLTVLPTIAWARRKERAVVAAATLLFAASVAVPGLSLRWFQAQTNTAAGAGENWPWLEFAWYELESVLQVAVSCLILTLPVLAISLRRAGLHPARKLALGLLLSAGIVAAQLWLFGDPLLLGNIIEPTGFLGQGVEALGRKPEILTAPVRMFLGLAVVAGGGFTFASLGRISDPLQRRFLLIAAPPTALYTAAILYRAVRDWLLFDRYMLLLLPVLIFPLLWRYQRNVRGAPPRLGWALLAAFALYGVASTHDYLAAGRAKVRAASALTGAGVPRTRITAGLEYDAWTELEHSGRIRKDNAAPDEYWFWKYTPSLRPAYFVAYSRLEGMVDAAAPARYTAWLPPFRRQIVTLTPPSRRGSEAGPRRKGAVN